MPAEHLAEVTDFKGFVKIKSILDGFATVIASESKLKKDRLRFEEDAAWQNL